MGFETVFEQTVKTLCFIVAGVSAVLGVVAVISPKLFKTLSRIGGYWVRTPGALPGADKLIDIEPFFLARCRLTGLVILGLAAILTMFCLVW